MSAPTVYPVHIDAALDGHLSRWLWLVKWLLVIPHYVVLAFLWVAFVVMSVAAFFAILFTGQYPRAIFDFNVGVMRWSWRVNYYAYGALGTDRYPPFTLADVPGYPAHLVVEYPERLSRGLVLVKWWLLAIPHYIIVGLFVGGGSWMANRSDDNWQWSWGGGGLIGLLVLVAAVILAVTGSYPRPLYDFVLGMNRWALRVAGYAALMTDTYPPFRLDMGGPDAGALSLSTPPEPTTSPGSRWTTGRVITIVVGSVLAFMAAGLLAGGAAALWADRAARDSTGYLTTPTVTLSTESYAIASDRVVLNGNGPAWAYPNAVLGTVRIRVSALDTTRPVFIGVAPTTSATTYLSSMNFATVTNVGGRGTSFKEHAGGTPSASPDQLGIWTARAVGPGTQVLTWVPSSGDWTIVVMNAGAEQGVSVQADVASTVPHLAWVSVGLLIAGALLLACGAAAISFTVLSTNRSPLT